MDIDEMGDEREMNLFVGLLVNSLLQRAAIATGNPRSEAWRFERMSAYELIRENNIAKNRETMKRLGLDKSFEEMQEEMGGGAGKGKRKTAGATGNGKPGGRKTKRTRVDADGGSGGDDEEDYEDDDGEDVVLASKPPAQPRAQRMKPTAAKPAPKEWVLKAKTLLEEKAFGGLWPELVEQWYLREESKNFVSPVSVFVQGIKIRCLLLSCRPRDIQLNCVPHKLGRGCKGPGTVPRIFGTSRLSGRRGRFGGGISTHRGARRSHRCPGRTATGRRWICRAPMGSSTS
jgi:hypothetical protein